MTAGHIALRRIRSQSKAHIRDALARVGCPDRRIDRLCITCCSSSQLSDAEHPGGLGVDDEFEPARLHDRQVRRVAPLRMLPGDAIRPRPLIARPTPKPQLTPAIPPTQNLANLSRAAAHPSSCSTRKSPGAAATRLSQVGVGVPTVRVM